MNLHFSLPFRILLSAIVLMQTSCFTDNKVCLERYDIEVHGASLTPQNTEAYCMWYRTDTLYSELNFILATYRVGVEYGCSETKPEYEVYRDSIYVYALDTMFSGEDTLPPYENLFGYFRKELTCYGREIYVFRTDEYPMFTMKHNAQHYYFEIPTNSDVVLRSDVVIRFF